MVETTDGGSDRQPVVRLVSKSDRFQAYNILSERSQFCKKNSIRDVSNMIESEYRIVLKEPKTGNQKLNNPRYDFTVSRLPVEACEKVDT